MVGGVSWLGYVCSRQLSVSVAPTSMYEAEVCLIDKTMPLPRALRGGHASKSAVAETVGGASWWLDKAKFRNFYFVKTPDIDRG